MSCPDCSHCDQPPLWEHSADGLFIKQIYLHEAGSVVPQHSHRFAHTTLLAMGKIHAWAGEEDLGILVAPCPILIKAKVKHTFQALEDHTLLYCIHNIRDRDGVEIHEEHQLPNSLFALKALR